MAYRMHFDSMRLVLPYSLHSHVEGVKALAHETIVAVRNYGLSEQKQTASEQSLQKLWETWTHDT